MIRDDIKVILYKENTTLKALAEKLSVAQGREITADGISHKLRKNTIRYEEVLQIFDALGYDLVIRKRK